MDAKVDFARRIQVAHVLAAIADGLRSVDIAPRMGMDAAKLQPTLTAMRRDAEVDLKRVAGAWHYKLTAKGRPLTRHEVPTGNVGVYDHKALAEALSSWIPSEKAIMEELTA